MRERQKNKKPGFATRAIHEGQEASNFLGALTPPAFMTSTYAFPSVEEGEAIFRGEAHGYGRTPAIRFLGLRAINNQDRSIGYLYF